MVNFWIYAYGSCLNASCQATTEPNSNLDQVARACTWQISSIASEQAHLPTENKYATALSQNKLKE